MINNNGSLEHEILNYCHRNTLVLKQMSITEIKEHLKIIFPWANPAARINALVEWDKETINSKQE